MKIEKDIIKEHISGMFLYIKALAKWVLVSSLAGILCGFIGSAFHLGVSYVTTMRASSPWLLYLLPAAGIVIVALYRLCSVEGHSTNNVISEVQTGKGLRWGLIPAVFFSTIVTHLCGGSSGREGAALQMGGTIGFELGKLLHLDDKDLRTATIVGMAAFFSALFGTPIAATIFAMAVISVGILYYNALIPCLLASLVAYRVSLLVGIEPTRFSVLTPSLSAAMLLRVSVLAALCAFLSAFFCSVLHFAEHWMQRNLPNPYLRILCGAVVIILLTLFCGTTDYNGAGSHVIVRAIEQERAAPWAFLLKILFTSVTLAAGFKGGEVVPSFFIGAVFGCIIGPLLGIPAGFAAAVGLICVFCGAVNCPIASVFLSIELFGSEALIYFTVACALSYVLSGYSGLYSSQRILYDKIKARYIDIHTNSYYQGES